MIRDKLKKKPPDMAKILKFAESGAKLDGLTFEGKPLLLYFEEERSFKAVEAALADDEKIFTSTKKGDDGITAEIRTRIAAAPDAVKALQVYFENKRYRGYTDTVVYRKADMEVPEYLQAAVQKTGADWLVLLKKEIHARHGAVFTDPPAGKIFRGCSWYSAKPLMPFLLPAPRFSSPAVRRQSAPGTGRLPV